MARTVRRGRGSRGGNMKGRDAPRNWEFDLMVMVTKLEKGTFGGQDHLVSFNFYIIFTSRRHIIEVAVCFRAS